MALKSAEMGTSASNSQPILWTGGVPKVAIAPTLEANMIPVIAMLIRFNSDVAILKLITVSSLPIAISDRSAGLLSKVSNVPRSFSPAHKSMAG